MVFFSGSTAFYWGGVCKSENSVMSLLGSRLAWLAFPVWRWWATMVRWYESYLLGPDIGPTRQQPLTNVFVMFLLVTGCSICTTKKPLRTRALGAL